ncbi:MAG: DUF2336 domain-containing protein [Pseudomonadota bacterium]
MSVSSFRPQLSDADINRLVKGETAEARASVAHRLCRRISLDVLSEDERQYAQDIIRILARDTAELVRRTLSITLRNSPVLPREIAIKLAKDVETVALPLLETSPVFTDEDLIELVLTASQAKQEAIAGRETVSVSVSEAIAEHAAVQAVRRLADNEGAELSDKAFSDSLERFGDDADLQGALVRRNYVPPHIAEKMVSLVSGQVFDMLVNRHELPAQMAIDLAAGARERATVDLVEQAGRRADLPKFTSQLNLNGRLSHSLVIRSLCMGHMSFVEHALAELSGVPHQRVWLMVHDAGPLGLQAVFDRAGLPRKYLNVFREAVSIFHETHFDGEADDRLRFRMRMIERVLTQYQALAQEDVDYLLEKLDAYGAELNGTDESEVA